MTTKTIAPEKSSVDDRALADKPAWRRLIGATGMWVLGLDIALVVVFTIASPNNVFWSQLNLQNQLLNGATGLLLALAVTVLLGAGLLDLSVGANLVLSSVVAARVVAGFGETGALGEANVYSNPVAAIALGAVICVVVGIAFGVVNGLVIAYLRVNSLIATLGTSSVALGLTLILTGGSDVGGLPTELQSGIGFNKLFGVFPVPAAIAILVAVLIWAVMRYLRFGTYTLSIGSSRVATERAGIKVRPHIVKLTALAGGLAGLAGLLSLAQFGSTTINGHANDPLAAITAAVIGGAALTGGRISIVGTVWGAALAGILLGGLVIMGVSAYYQLVAIGLILIFAVAVDQFRNRRRERL